jgi:hypothetical protein
LRSRPGLETPLDDAVNLALDILENAYEIRGGERVPVGVNGTDRVTASPRYRPAAGAYSVVQPRFWEVSVHLGRLQELDKTKSYRNDNGGLIPVDVARVVGHQLTTAARESAAGIYERTPARSPFTQDQVSTRIEDHR